MLLMAMLLRQRRKRVVHNWDPAHADFQMGSSSSFSECVAFDESCVPASLLHNYDHICRLSHLSASVRRIPRSSCGCTLNMARPITETDLFAFIDFSPRPFTSDSPMHPSLPPAQQLPGGYSASPLSLLSPRRTNLRDHL
jgi:hypothetical protein